MINKFLLLWLLVLSTFLYPEEIQHEVISCEPFLIYKCDPDECMKVDIVDIEGDQYFEVDTIKNTLVGKIGMQVVDLENIVSKKIEGDSYLFVGTHLDSAYDWILRVNKTGKMTLVGVEGESGSFSIYGRCKWKENK
jgi:hypothetical protein